ncbi:hypothetical protein CK203_076831 [Vitis vinifera]|uniref:STM1-like N-terminal domain-containing protein n=1 Tax=Vitis vinifera TaxID=29760 RepID=A0A438ESN3_VITVI|nr:hypothetical protein CK203_076831 [Vitis vinifera]
MATTNPFDLLGDDDNDDPSQLASHLLKLAPAKKSSAPPPQAAPAQQAKPAKLPSKPLPPAQAGKGMILNLVVVVGLVSKEGLISADDTWCRLSTICLPLRIVALELIFRSFNGVLYCVWVWNLLCVKLEYLG